MMIMMMMYELVPFFVVFFCSVLRMRPTSWMTDEPSSSSQVIQASLLRGFFSSTLIVANFKMEVTYLYPVLWVQ